jgi:hypothetical protein
MQRVFSDTGSVAMNPQGHQSRIGQQAARMPLAHELGPQWNNLRESFVTVFHKTSCSLRIFTDSSQPLLF